jgi:N-acetylmuramoyl-L-alanine amidase
MKLVISAGHGKYIRGAAGPSPWGLDEVDEARKVVTATAEELRKLGVEVVTYWDDVSHSQNENLNRIVDFHNDQSRDLDVSIHFNAYEVTTTKPMGCEVLYVSNSGNLIATDVVNKICTASGLKNRGPKKRTDLFFLNNTSEPAVLVETAFCDAKIDCDIYRAGFDAICSAIASGLAGEDVAPGPEPEPPDAGVLFSASGTCSWFGGPADTGVSPSEGLAFIYDYDEAPYLFLPQQPQGTTGLARRLDPSVFYIACRWDYDVTSKLLLRDSGQMALVTAKETGIARLAHPADWGPHEEQTGRAADLSPGLMDNLGIDTDDEVTVVYPYNAPA